MTCKQCRVKKDLTRKNLKVRPSRPAAPLIPNTYRTWSALRADSNLGVESNCELIESLINIVYYNDHACSSIAAHTRRTHLHLQPLTAAPRPIRGLELYLKCPRPTRASGCPRRRWARAASRTSSREAPVLPWTCPRAFPSPATSQTPTGHATRTRCCG